MRTRKRLIDLMRSVNADVIGANHTEWLKEASICLQSRARCLTCRNRMGDIQKSNASPSVKEMAFDAEAYLAGAVIDAEEPEEQDAGPP